MTAADTAWASEINPVSFFFLNAFAIALFVACIIAWTRHLRGKRERPSSAASKLKPWSVSWLDAVAIIGSAIILIWFAQNLLVVLLQHYHGKDFRLDDAGLWTLSAFGLAVQLPLLITVVLGRYLYPNHFPARLRENRVTILPSLRIVADVYFRFLPPLLLLMLGWTLVLAVLAEAGWIAPPEPQLLVTVFAFSDEWVARLVFVFIAALLAPVAEELFFRGIIYRFLKARIGLPLALLLSALLFALVHNNLHAFAGLFALGVLLALLYEKTGDIRVPMLFHAAFNLTSLSILSIGG